MKRALAAWAAWVMLGAASAAAACPPLPADGRAIAGAGVEAAWRVADGAALAVGRPFAIEVLVCPPQAQLVEVDATMPAHRHGMNYRPSIATGEAGRYRVEGLLWHMPGAWELALTLRTADGQRQQLRQAVELR